MLNYVIQIDLRSGEKKKEDMEKELQLTLNEPIDYTTQLVVATEMNGKFYNVKDILSSTALNNTIYLDSSDDVEFPYLVCESSYQDISPIFAMFKQSDFKISKEKLEPVAKALAPTYGELFTADTLEQLQSACSSFDKYLNGERVKIKMSMAWYKHVARTKKLVLEINSSGRAETIYIEGENKTLFRAEPDDELFIRVPTYDELSISNVKVLPKSICIPYTDNSLRTADFREHITEATPIEMVVGNPANNDLDILDSEKRFKSALMSLMDSGTSIEFPDVPLEKCKEQNIGSTLVKEYIKTLALCAAKMNWNHSGFLPVMKYDSSLEDDEDDDDEDREESEAKAALGSVAWSTEGFGGKPSLPSDALVDGSSIIYRFIDKAFNRDVYSIIDIVIKMFRFGKLKPSRIKLTPNGSSELTEYIDLTDCYFYKNSGNYSSVDIVCDEKGNNLTPLCSIKMMSYLSDRNYIKSNNLKNSNVDMNVGIVCERKYTGDSFSQKVLLSYIDIIKAYEDNDPLCKIKGFSYDGTNLLVDGSTTTILNTVTKSLRELSQSVINCSTGEYEFFCYSGFKDSFMIKGCWDKKLSVLRILNEFFGSNDLTLLSACSYDTIEELDLKCGQFAIPPRACIENNIARYLIPLICDVSMIYENLVMGGKEVSVSDLILVFRQVIKDKGFIGTFGLSEVKETLPSAIKESSSFKTKVIKEGGYNILEEVVESNLEGYSIYKLILNKELTEKVKGSFKGFNVIDVEPTTGYNVVGYLGFKSKADPKIFIDPNSVQTNIKGVYDIVKACPGLMGILLKCLQESKQVSKFDSVETGLYYCRLGNYIYKGLIE